MKKLVSSTLAAILLTSSISVALAANADNKGNGHGNSNGKAEVKAEARANTNDETAESSDSSAADPEDANPSSIKDVALTKQLIELRQELKHAAEVTAEQKKKYEQLVADLEKKADKHGALVVQLELLSRTYQKGDHTPFKKVGELLESAGEKDVKAFVDGELVQSDVAPFVQGGRALVPVRAISSALKADVKWDAEKRTVLITRGEQSITLYVDKKEATVNGKTIALDIAPVLKNGRVFLPLRFISEQLNANVDWQEEGKIVIIDDLQEQDEAKADDSRKDDSSNADKESEASSTESTGTK